MKYCSNCGRPLQEGEVCHCQDQTENMETQQEFNFKHLLNDEASSTEQTQVQSEPVHDEGNPLPKAPANKFLIPGVIQSNDGEIPVRQYDIAFIQKLHFGLIPGRKALARLLVTNQRILYSARGNSIHGTEINQQEFDISEIGGFKFEETRTVGIFRAIFIILLSLLLSSAVISYFHFSSGSSPTTTTLLALILSGASIALIVTRLLPPVLPWFFSSIGLGYALSIFGNHPTGFTALVLCFTLVPFFVSLPLVAQVHRIIITISTKSAGEALVMGPKVNDHGKASKFDRNQQVLPARDTYVAFKELGAMVNDIQSKGDYGVNKWRRL